MDELLELGVVIIAAVIGIISKANKNKKKAQQKPSSAWEAVGEKVLEFIEDDGEEAEEESVQLEMSIPYAPQPVVPPVPAQPAVSQPAVSQPAVAQPIVSQPVQQMPSNEGKISGEGDCDHPLHEPVKVPARKPAAKQTPALEVERHYRHGSFVPAGVNAAGLRQAVIMSEVLGKPVSLRGASRR